MTGEINKENISEAHEKALTKLEAEDWKSKSGNLNLFSNLIVGFVTILAGTMILNEFSKSMKNGFPKRKKEKKWPIKNYRY